MCTPLQHCLCCTSQPIPGTLCYTQLHTVFRLCTCYLRLEQICYSQHRHRVPFTQTPSCIGFSAAACKCSVQISISECALRRSSSGVRRAPKDVPQPKADHKRCCHTFFDTLHAAPSSAICRAPGHTRYLRIASEFVFKQIDSSFLTLVGPMMCLPKPP